VNKTEKQDSVAQLKESFLALKTILLIDYKGLNVPNATELRRLVRKAHGEYKVVKNTLALRAAQDTTVEQVKDHFSGPTAVIYTSKDPVALAKVVVEFAKTVPAINFKAGVVEGRPVTAAQVLELTKLPSRPELIGKLLFLLNSPLTRLVTVLNAPIRNLAVVLGQIKKAE
jgi:large subunit ribosomal protein L10